MTGCAAGMMISSDELFRRRAKVRRCACGPNDRDTGDTLRRSHAFSIDDDDIHIVWLVCLAWFPLYIAPQKSVAFMLLCFSTVVANCLLVCAQYRGVCFFSRRIKQKHCVQRNIHKTCFF